MEEADVRLRRKCAEVYKCVSLAFANDCDECRSYHMDVGSVSNLLLLGVVYRLFVERSFTYSGQFWILAMSRHWLLRDREVREIGDYAGIGSSMTRGQSE